MLETIDLQLFEFSRTFNANNSELADVEPVKDEFDDVYTAINTKVAKAGDTLTGALNFADQQAVRPEIKDYAETAATNATSGATATIDLESGNVHDVTLTDNCTFTFSNPPATGKAGSFTLILRQDGTGSRTVTWPASVDWPEGTAPTISTAASAVDVLVFVTVDGGTTWLGMLAGAAFS